MPLTKLAYSQAADAELLQSVKQSDSKAFEELYNRYFPSLVDTAYKRLNSKQKGEDIVQNIFVDFYHRRSNIEINTSLKAYLHQALKYRVLNEWRAEVTRLRYHQTHFLNNNCKIDFSDRLETKELEAKIQDALDRLPKKCKQVFLLSRRGTLSNHDIASKLNIAVSTVEKHITKALRTLRLALSIPMAAA